MPLLLKLLSGSAGPWILVGLLLAAVGGSAYLYDLGKRRQADADQAVYDEALQRAVAKREAQFQEDLKKRDESDRLTAQAMAAVNTELQNRLAELAARPPKTLIQTKVVDHECPTVSLSRDFWTLYRAAGVSNAAPASPH